ncbi:MAG: segregation/condensation protein A [Alphaproteobacteria bacterium]|nr:segregation/condensation protein A [Alphaproteobacteria bacterium]
MQNVLEAEKIEFQEDPPRVAPAGEHDADSLLLNIDGYEGPIDVLLDLARNQKVDLTKISILQLARQYLEFVERAKQLDLELAAEYLVMAAWLAYLNSRLLLPRDNESTDPTAEEMAEALQFQLRRLEAMRNAAEALKNLPQLGQQVFARGMGEGLAVNTKTTWEVTLYDLLKAYGDIRFRKESSHYDLPVFSLMSMEDAVSRLTRMLGQLPRQGLHSVWATLESFLPSDIKDKLFARSALASTMTAALELAKQGRLEIKQDGLFRPVYMRATGESNEQPGTANN